ncbi:hypothetical protein DL769_010784 [Monosporascus sp. CRB-8-3]|nr:hypothetical protein DL769_010784 [Monosporascus sp. CRB-8-3]
MVKRLNCAINLRGVGDGGGALYDSDAITHSWLKARNDNEFHPRSGDPMFDILRLSHLTDEEGTKDNVTGEAIFGAILCLTPNLEIIRLSCPSWLAHTRRYVTGWYPELSEIINTFTTNPVADQPRPLGKLHEAIFLRDEDYAIDPYSDDFYRGGIWGTCFGICPALLRAPNLSSIRATQLGSAPWNMIPQHLKHLTLPYPRAITSGDAVILFSLSHLEELKLYRIDGDYGGFPHDICLNSELKKHAHRLTRLAITTFQDFRRLLEIGFGPSHRLDCLADFSVLLELEVDLFALVGSRLNMRDTQLEKTLPVSLKKLVLWEEWWADDEDHAADGYDASEREYWDDMHDMFRRFAISCKARCTNLATVHLQNNDGSALDDDAYYDIKALFEEAGVEFDVDNLRTRHAWDDDDA